MHLCHERVPLRAQQGRARYPHLGLSSGSTGRRRRDRAFQSEAEASDGRTAGCWEALGGALGCLH